MTRKLLFAIPLIIFSEASHAEKGVIQATGGYYNGPNLTFYGTLSGYCPKTIESPAMNFPITVHPKRGKAISVPTQATLTGTLKKGGETNTCLYKGEVSFQHIVHNGQQYTLRPIKTLVEFKISSPKNFAQQTKIVYKTDTGSLLIYPTYKRPNKFNMSLITSSNQLGLRSIPCLLLQLTFLAKPLKLREALQKR